MSDSDFKRFKTAMAWRDITQQQLAKSLGVTQSMVAYAVTQIRGGKPWPPSVSRERVAKVLQVEPEQLVGGGSPLVFGDDELQSLMRELEAALAHVKQVANKINLLKQRWEEV